MSKNFCLAMAILITTTACHSGDGPKTPATAILNKIEHLIDTKRLDYAAAKKFLGIPLHTMKFEAMASGNKIISRSGEYSVKRGNIYPPEFTYISFDMAWEGESNQPSTKGWHREKGLRSSLRVSFDQKKVCITKDLLEDELGSGEQGGFADSEAVGITYGDRDMLIVSFTFNQPGCADSMDVMANNAGASWPTPADASVSDAEFVTKLLPLDKSGKQLQPLGFHCGPDDSPGKPEDTACGCDRDKQTPEGPCHHAVTLSSLPGGDLKIEMWPLLIAEANGE